MLENDAERLIQLYPRIFFACHTQHVKDPTTRQVLSSHQASILDHLDEVEGTTLGGLAAHMGVTASTMCISIDRLAHQGYVRRMRDTVDGRKVVLRLTVAGMRIKGAQSVLDPERVRALLSHLTGKQRTEAIGGLTLLARAAQEEMRNKVLYGLRPHRGGSQTKGGHHAKVDSHRSGRSRRPHRGHDDRRAAAPERS